MITKETHDKIWKAIYDLVKADVLNNPPEEVVRHGVSPDDIDDVADVVFRDLDDGLFGSPLNVFNTAVLDAVSDAFDDLEIKYGVNKETGYTAHWESFNDVR